MEILKNIVTSWPLYSTKYVPLLRYRKYDNIPINENCEFSVLIKLYDGGTNKTTFAKVYIKYNETTHIIKEIENNDGIVWEIGEKDEYYYLLVKSPSTNSSGSIQAILENYRNRGYVELLNYEENVDIANYTKIEKETIKEFITSNCSASSYKKFGSVTVYNQQFNVSKFMIVQRGTDRNTTLYAEFVLRVLNGTPNLIILNKSEDFANSLINIHAVKNGNVIDLYWQNVYTSITNKVIIKKLYDCNSSNNKFELKDGEELTELTPTISLL